MKQKFKQTEIGKIPEDWKEEIFSEVIAVNPKRELKKGTEAKFVSMADIKEFDKKIQGYTIKKFSGGSKFINSDTLMARITPCLENGKTAFVNILDDKGIGSGSTEFIVLSAKEDKTIPQFVYYVAISPEIRTIAIKSMTGTSGRQRVENDIFDKITIILPSIPEQKLIANILSNLDNKIALNRSMNSTLEAIGQALFKHWFVDFEFPNEKGKPYISSGGKMVETELGKVPKGWSVGTVADLCVSITNGGTPKRMENRYWKDGTISWYKTGELFDEPLLDSEEHITEEGLKESSCHLWEPDTILIALYASPTVGRLGLLKTRGTANQACSGLVAKTEVGYQFLFFTLLFERDDFNMVAVGSAQQNISQQIVKDQKVIIPPSGITSNFKKTLEPLFDHITSNIIESHTLAAIRDALLPKLMSGEIRVPVEVRT